MIYASGATKSVIHGDKYIPYCSNSIALQTVFLGKLRTSESPSLEMLPYRQPASLQRGGFAAAPTY